MQQDQRFATVPRTVHKEDAMDYVKPYGVVDSMLAGGAVKLSLPPRQLILRGMLAGAYLGIGTSMAVTVAVETGYWIIGSLLFPFGLALAILLGAEIITGSFALLPCAAVAGQKNAGLRQVFANWGWVFLGNLLGSTLVCGVVRDCPHDRRRRPDQCSRDQADCDCRSENQLLCVTRHGWPPRGLHERDAL